MSSYLSNLLTQTTSKYNSIRRTLLANEEDGDTEDDSHISRVLRAYYTEKGRPFPPWLPPDPNDRRALPPPQAASSNSGYFTGAGVRNHVTAVQNQPGSRSSLNDLWDPPASQQPAAPMQPQSLRNMRRPMPPAQSTSTLAPPQARPLPSQRAGSYQSMQSQQSGRMSADPGPPMNNSGYGGTAQDRLKQRLWAAGTSGSPSSSPGLSQVGSANPYEQLAAGNGIPHRGRADGDQYDGGGAGRNRRYGRVG